MSEDSIESCREADDRAVQEVVSALLKTGDACIIIPYWMLASYFMGKIDVALDHAGVKPLQFSRSSGAYYTSAGTLRVLPADLGRIRGFKSHFVLAPGVFERLGSEIKDEFVAQLATCQIEGENHEH